MVARQKLSRQILWILHDAREQEPGIAVGFVCASSGSGDAYGVWSPDGTRIAFSSARAGHADLYQHAANGANEDELLFKSGNDKYVDDWSRDGRFLMFSEMNASGKLEIWVLPMSGEGERKPAPFLRTAFDQRRGSSRRTAAGSPTRPRKPGEGYGAARRAMSVRKIGNCPAYMA